MHGNIHFGLGNRGLRWHLPINSPSTQSVALGGTALDCCVARAPRNDGVEKEPRVYFSLVPRTQRSSVAHCSASGTQETCREIPLPARSNRLRVFLETRRLREIRDQFAIVQREAAR